MEFGICRLDLVELRDYCTGMGMALGELIAQWELRIQPGKARSTKAKRKSK